MNRLSRVAVLLTAALGALLAVAPAPAQADPVGGVVVIPGSDNDLVAISVVVVIFTFVAVAVANRFWKRRFS